MTIMREMSKKNTNLDELAKTFLRDNFGSNVTFTDHGDLNDKIGIDGFIKLENILLPFSLRNRKINEVFGTRDVSWTMIWANGDQGEWFYTQEQYRFHFWSRNGSIAKAVLVDSKAMFEDRKKWETLGETKLNGENGQTAIYLKLNDLRNEGLIEWEWPLA